MVKAKTRAKSEYEEGTTAARRFDDVVRQAIAVPKSEIDQRQKEWEKKRKANGRKRKVK